VTEKAWEGVSLAIVKTGWHIKQCDSGKIKRVLNHQSENPLFRFCNSLEKFFEFTKKRAPLFRGKR